jgi:DnaA family protein
LYRPAPGLPPHAVSQLVLDLGPPPPPTFDAFVVGDNREALDAVRGLADPGRGAGARFLYLWGPASSGRSHLLRSLEGALPAGAARRLDPQAPLDAFVHAPAVRTWLIDDCDRLDPARQAAAWHLFDAVAAHADTALACAGAEPPGRLALMPELATRLGWGLVLQLRRLSDTDTAQALARTFAERGLSVAPDVVPWLMSHAPRDLGSLRALVDALDGYALARKRAITVPLLREFAQAGLPLEAPTPAAATGIPPPPAVGPADDLP